MASWDIQPGTHWRVCQVCCCVTRHDAGWCMYDRSSPIARLVRRDVPEASTACNRHEPQGLFDLPPVPPNGGCA